MCLCYRLQTSLQGSSLYIFNGLVSVSTLPAMYSSLGLSFYLTPLISQGTKVFQAPGVLFSFTIVPPPPQLSVRPV